MKGLVNFCWFFFKWGLALAFVGALAAIPYLYHRVDEEIRLQVERRIAAQYPHLSVRVRFAQLIEGQGIEVRGLSIAERDAAGPQAELAYLDELFLSCQTNLQQLLQGQPNVTHITVRRPIVRATRRPDGSWSVGRLLPLPKFGDCTPEGTVENGTVEIFDPLKRSLSTFTFRDIHLKLRPLRPDEDKARGSLRVEGNLVADHVERLKLQGTFDPTGARWSIGGSVEGLDVSPELRTSLPGNLAERLEVLGTLRGRTEFHFQVTSPAAGESVPQFDLAGQLERGSINDPRLPYPLTDLRTNFHFDSRGFALDDFFARSGQATLALSCWRQGYDEQSRAGLSIRAERMRLDRELLNVLPQSYALLWYKHLPQGDVNVDAELEFDGHDWTRRDVMVNCLDVSFTSHNFPYRLERGTGKLSLKGDKLSINLQAYSGAQLVWLDGEFQNPGPSYTGRIDLRAERIPFDEKLFAALRPKARAVVRSLNPRETFNVDARLWRDDPREPGMHHWVYINLNNCRMSYDKFPYPLTNLRGRIELRDGQWKFDHLTGENDTGSIVATGSLTTSPRDSRLVLKLSGSDVPLEIELRDAFEPNLRQLWDSLHPRGACSFAADIGYESQSGRMTVELWAKPRPEVTSIEPVCFPYEMQGLNGEIHYKDRHVDLIGMQAVHRRTSVATNGSCDFAPDGSWALRLAGFRAEHLSADHDLVAALPEGLKRAAAEVKPSGSFTIEDGQIDFARSGAPSAPLSSRWNVRLNMIQGALNGGTKLENVYGGIQLTGAAEGSRFWSRGELSLDSLNFRNLQLTEIMGPIWIDNQHLGLGSTALERDAPPRRVTAKLFGGMLMGDGAITLGSPAAFDLYAELSGAELGKFAKENLTGRQRLNGKVLANVRLKGTTSGPHTFGGDGNIHLVEADIYELPVMVALLKILSIRRPDTTAFTKSDINFEIKGHYVVFNRIDFIGDAISLTGTGWMNLDRQTNPVDLTFQAALLRDGHRMPILRDVLGEASQQIMQVRVQGSAEHPITRVEAFPGVNQALQRLQADLQRSPQVPPASYPGASGLAPRAQSVR